MQNQEEQIEKFNEETQIAESLQNGEITSSDVSIDVASEVDQEAERVAIESEGDALELSQVAEPTPEEEKVKPAQDEPSPEKQKTIIMPIKRTLTIEEKDRIANKMTQAIDDIKELESEKKAVAKDYASRIEQKQKTLEHYSDQYKTNSKTEQVEVRPFKNYELKVWQYFEVGTEKLVHEAPFKSKDYQTSIVEETPELEEGEPVIAATDEKQPDFVAIDDVETEQPSIEELAKAIENAVPEQQEELKSSERKDGPFNFAQEKSEMPSPERIERAIEIVTQGYEMSLIKDDAEQHPGGDVSIEQTEVPQQTPKKRKKLFGIV